MGSLISETNILSFYSTGFPKFVTGSWASFEKALFAAAVPADWNLVLREQAQHLRMGDIGTFVAYSTRARTLQSLINFEREIVSDFQLAGFMVFGMPPELEADVKSFDLVVEEGFVYSSFERRASNLHASLILKGVLGRRPNRPIAA